MRVIATSETILYPDPRDQVILADHALAIRIRYSKRSAPGLEEIAQLATEFTSFRVEAVPKKYGKLRLTRSGSLPPGRVPVNQSNDKLV
jgi:hypothetical protein